MLLKLPDQSLHQKYLTSFLALIIASVLQGILIFLLSYFSGDFTLMCCILTPFGLGYLLVNFLTYRECRRLHVDNHLSYRDAVFISALASISNILPIVFALLALTIGFIIGGDYNPWMNEISGRDYLLGIGSMLLIFFPFNMISTLIASVFFVYLRRRDPWVYQPETM
jgi:hypothetical protein